MDAMNMELIWACIGIMGKGMLGIFVVIVLIYLVVLVLTKVTGNKEKEEK